MKRKVKRKIIILLICGKCGRLNKEKGLLPFFPISLTLSTLKIMLDFYIKPYGRHH